MPWGYLESFQWQRKSDINGLYVSCFPLKEAKFFFINFWKNCYFCPKTPSTLYFNSQQRYTYWIYITIRKPNCVVTAKFIFSFPSDGKCNLTLKASARITFSMNCPQRFTTIYIWRKIHSCNELTWIWIIYFFLL